MSIEEVKKAKMRAEELIVKTLYYLEEDTGMKISNWDLTEENTTPAGPKMRTLKLTLEL